jgi:hypothetical protein
MFSKNWSGWLIRIECFEASCISQDGDDRKPAVIGAS